MTWIAHAIMSMQGYMCHMFVCMFMCACMWLKKMDMLWWHELRMRWCLCRYTCVCLSVCLCVHVCGSRRWICCGDMNCACNDVYAGIHVYVYLYVYVYVWYACVHMCPHAASSDTQTRTHTRTHAHTCCKMPDDCSEVRILCIYVYVHPHPHTHTHTHTNRHPTSFQMAPLKCEYLIYIYIYTHTYIHTYIHTHPHTHKIGTLRATRRSLRSAHHNTRCCISERAALGGVGSSSAGPCRSEVAS